MQYTHPVTKSCINSIHSHRTEAKALQIKDIYNKTITQSDQPATQAKRDKRQRKQKAIRWRKTKANRFATTHKAIRPGRQASRQS